MIQQLKKLILFSLVFTFMLAIASAPGEAHASQKVTYPYLSQGSQGDFVWDLQYRLKTRDFYNKPLDGKFGAYTKQAVKRYQKTYGLKADGRVGRWTWLSLKKFTLNQAEVDLMARLVYGEARGESYEGQVAVAAVVMNRLRSDQFPDSIKGIIYQSQAFTAVADGQFHMTPDSEAYRAVLEAVKGWDPTHGALYYYNPSTATSNWIRSRPQVVTIGAHVFAD